MFEFSFLLFLLNCISYMSICNSGHRELWLLSYIFLFFYKTKRFMEAGLVNYRRKYIIMCVFVCFVLHSLLSTLKNKELSPVIGQKGLQGAVTSSGQLQLSDHSPHTLRRGNTTNWACMTGISACLKNMVKIVKVITFGDLKTLHLAQYCDSKKRCSTLCSFSCLSGSNRICLIY